MPAQGIQLLADDLVPAISGFVFSEPVKVSPDDSGPMTDDSIEIWQSIEVRVVENGQYPVVGSVNAIETPFGSAKDAVSCAGHGQ